VQRIENKAKTYSGKLARAMLLYQEIPSSNMQRVKSPHATSASTWLTRGSTWHATWRPAPPRPMTRLLTGGQPSLTGGPAVLNGGLPPLTAGDHRSPPSLTAVDHR
ncbi:hypothetical protein Tco_0081511, partial [Tanacetum coccineum]